MLGVEPGLHTLRISWNGKSLLAIHGCISQSSGRALTIHFNPRSPAGISPRTRLTDFPALQRELWGIAIHLQDRLLQVGQNLIERTLQRTIKRAASGILVSTAAQPLSNRCYIHLAFAAQA